jgi:hypothetical protein
MNSFGAVLLLATATFALPPFQSQLPSRSQFRPGYTGQYKQGFGSYGFGNNYTPMPLSNFRYANNPYRNEVHNHNFHYQGQGQQFGQGQKFFNPSRATFNPTFNPSRNAGPAITGLSLSPQGISEARTTYLPVMKALLKVMKTNKPSPQDINTLMVLTRELSKKVPKEANIMKMLGNFGIDNLESMGLPETGDIIVVADGVPHIKTTFGTYPLSDTSLMTSVERAQFLPIVKTFTNILEKGSADSSEIQTLLQQAKELTKFLPGNLQSSLEGLTDNFIGQNF